MTGPLELACPRCGAARQPDQEYCLECGLKLPTTTGGLARVRRSWVKRFGWYPGDWVWTTLLALVVAAAGAAVAIATSTDASSKSGGTTINAATHSVPLTMPTTTAAAPTVDTTTLPTPPEPTTTGKGKASKPPKAPVNGRTPWPAGQTGWTVVLESVPATAAGRKTAEARADRAAQANLPEVGILVSSRYSTLHPGYFVIFSGIYDTRSEAESNLRAAQSGGFSSSYVRQIAQ